MITPPVGTVGVFSTKVPWVLDQSVIYKVGSIRSFADMIAEGIDPLAKVYTPVGLTNADYQVDVAAGAKVVTLLSNVAGDVYIPNTYISSYPNTALVPHKWVLLTVSLGMLPDGYDLTRAKEAVSTAVVQDIGVAPTVLVGVADVTTAITEEQAEQLRILRNQAIANQSTDYADKLALQSQLTEYKNLVGDLTTALANANARIHELTGQ